MTGYTAIELWNQMSEFKTRATSLPKTVLHAFFLQLMTYRPWMPTLKLWDELMLKHNRRWWQSGSRRA